MTTANLATLTDPLAPVAFDLPAAGETRAMYDYLYKRIRVVLVKLVRSGRFDDLLPFQNETCRTHDPVALNDVIAKWEVTFL